ncbi:MAG TPA: pyridoxal-phosphate dependent enzyme [Anaerolineae bacterium]|nr:pyridoxal-phosphate dependent enzyme [Anaerolineae bacterium]
MTKLTLHEIYLAQQRIAPHIIQTPLQRSLLLSAQLGCDLWLKLENRQHTGSFKPRGALNKIMSLSAEELSRGIVAASAGNHALGVAHAARQLNLSNVDVFVQANAAPAKIAKLRQYPINLHLMGDSFDEAQQAALAQAETTGATFVSAYDNVQVIAGQGTVGLEIMQALPDVETIIVPVGGGGLIAGVASVARSLNPLVRVVGVNPAASPSAYLSKRDGQPYDPYDHEPTLAQGLAGGFGRVPFMVGMMLIDEIVLVSEDEIKRGMAALIDSDQTLAEASGIVGLSALLSGKVSNSGKTVVVITGGNIDADTLRGVLSVNELSTNQRMADAPTTRTQPGLVHTANDPITYRLIGLAMEVHNELGPGHREAAYHNALVAKLKTTDLNFLDEPSIWVELDDETPVQKYVPDLIVQDSVIVELKAHRWSISRDEEAQIYDYFAGTDCTEALYFNFGKPRLEKRRLFRPAHIKPRQWQRPE